jgi:hypothetical protein
MMGTASVALQFTRPRLVKEVRMKLVYSTSWKLQFQEYFHKEMANSSLEEVLVQGALYNCEPAPNPSLLTCLIKQGNQRHHLNV